MTSIAEEENNNSRFIRKVGAARTNNGIYRRALLPKPSQRLESDFIELSQTQILLRAYEIVPHFDFSQPVPPGITFEEAYDSTKEQGIRVWDVTLGVHEVDPTLELFYEHEKPNAAIPFYTPWDGDKISFFQRRNKIMEPHVFTLDAKQVYLIQGSVTPQIIKEELDPDDSDKQFIRLGQFPFEIKGNLIPQMLGKAKIVPHVHVPFSSYTAAAEHDWHSLQDERILRKYCGAYQCPVCKPVERFENYILQLEEQNVIPKDERRFSAGRPAWERGLRGEIVEFPPKKKDKEKETMMASASIKLGSCNCIYCNNNNTRNAK
jgi:hypothetical protein